MALVFPRALPPVGVGRQTFELRRVDLLSPESSGRLGAIAVGFPLWMADWELGTFGEALSDEWRAWIASLEGPTRPFLGYEVGREFPRAHPTGFDGMIRPGGGLFDGSATGWDQTFTPDRQSILQLTGLPVGLRISIGDYVDFRWETAGEARRVLVRSLEHAAAAATGQIFFAVTPAIPDFTPAGAVAHLDNPACIMRLAPDETRVSAMDRRRSAGARIIGLQDLRP